MRRQRAKRPGAERAYRARYALQLPLAEILDGHTQPVGQVIADCGRDDYFLRPAKYHEARRQVDAVAIEIHVVGQDVGDMNSHAKMYPPIRLEIGIAELDAGLH